MDQWKAWDATVVRGNSGWMTQKASLKKDDSKSITQKSGTVGTSVVATTLGHWMMIMMMTTMLMIIMMFVVVFSFRYSHSFGHHV